MFIFDKKYLKVLRKDVSTMEVSNSSTVTLPDKDTVGKGFRPRPTVSTCVPVSLLV